MHFIHIYIYLFIYIYIFNDYLLVLELLRFCFACVTFHTLSLDLMYGTVMLMMKSSLKAIQRTVMLTVKSLIENICAHSEVKP